MKVNNDILTYEELHNIFSGHRPQSMPLRDMFREIVTNNNFTLDELLTFMDTHIDTPLQDVLADIVLYINNTPRGEFGSGRHNAVQIFADAYAEGYKVNKQSLLQVTPTEFMVMSGRFTGRIIIPSINKDTILSKSK